MHPSELVLTEILEMTATLVAEVNEYRKQLAVTNTDVSRLSNRLDEMMATAFPGNSIGTHAYDHSKIRQLSWWKRILLKMAQE